MLASIYTIPVGPERVKMSSRVFFLFHRVHAFQNNWQDITIIQADMVWETVHRSLIYL